MRKLIFLICFFSYSGYYAGLAILMALNMTYLSPYYSIPLRTILLIAMIYLIKENRFEMVNSKYFNVIPVFIIFWTFYIIKVLYSENITMSGELSRNWFEYIFYSLSFVFFPFLTFMSIPVEKYKDTIIDGFIFSGFTLGALSMFLYGSLLRSGIGRISLVVYETGETVLNPLSLSYSGVLTIILCIYKLVVSKNIKKKQRIYLWATIILSFGMFLLGSSRGSLVAIFLTMPIFLIYSSFTKKIKLIFVSFILTPVVVWLITISGSNIFERFENTSKDEGGGRDYLWTNALEHFMQNPIFGGKIEIGNIYPHNFLVEILMATGIFGFILIVPIICYGFKISYQKAKTNKSLLFILLILIQGFTQYFFSGSITTASLVFIPLGMAYSSNKV